MFLVEDVNLKTKYGGINQNEHWAIKWTVNFWNRWRKNRKTRDDFYKMVVLKNASIISSIQVIVNQKCQSIVHTKPSDFFFSPELMNWFHWLNWDPLIYTNSKIVYCLRLKELGAIHLVIIKMDFFQMPDVN